MKLPSFAPASLRAKLVLFSLLLVAVPGAVVALIAFASGRQALEAAVGRQLAEVADDAAETIAAGVADGRKDVRAWARQDFMREIVIGDLDKRISRFLASIEEGDGRYVELLCADAAGQVVAASKPALLGSSRGAQPWFRTAVAGNEVVAGPLRWPGTDHAVVEVASPIYDPERPGSVIGVLLGVYDWERAITALASLRHNLAELDLTVDFLILDEGGVVIGGPQEREAAALVGHNLRTAGWVAAQSGWATARPHHLREPAAHALVGVARLDAGRPGWVMLAVQPLGEALAPVYRMQQRLAGVLGAVLLAGLLVATVLAERMSRPLRALTRATREIAQAGETRTAVPVQSRDEIGQLARAFNAMAGELKRAQEALLVAKKFAFIGEVAAGIAHEVRTPLGILRSAAQLLDRSSPKGATSGELVETIVEEVDRLDRVVAGLLQLARPHQPIIEPSSLNALLGRTLDFVAARAHERQVSIRRAFAPQLPEALCDADQIHQVALNLLVNALQILSPGGELTVRTLPVGTTAVAFEVSDNGPGIPPDVREQIFTPFFTMQKGGTGLGLALVQRIVQAHKGTVSVDSHVGRGTTFRIELPVAGEPS